MPVLGSLLPLQRDALGFFTRTLREMGDRVQLRVLGQKVLLLCHPEDLEAVLVNDRDSYGRSSEIKNLRPIFGDGLLASAGELWKKQRRLIQPSFQHDVMQKYAEVMSECIAARVANWQDGDECEMHREMMDYTRDVVCRTLFGSEPDEDVDAIAQAVTVVFGDLRAEILYLPVWRRIPLPRSMRWNRAVGVLNKAVQRMIAARRASGKVRPDLLGALLTARDADGSSMPDQQVHDEILTMFLAGHETSALSLSWALYLLASHPEAQEKVAREVADLAAGRAVDAKDYPRLPYLAAVVRETMRLYPPVWSLGRNVEGATTLGGEPVAKRTRVWLCIYQMHRDVRWFAEPDRFDPERWLRGEARTKFSYLPFGAGPRMCIGQHFATAEAVLGLAEMLRVFRFSPVSDKEVKIDAWITLRPRGGVKLRLTRR